MPLAWSDDEAWILRTEQPLHGCAPPYVGNGRIGLRLGALILGTDLEAPPLVSPHAEICRTGTPAFDHSFPLQTFAAHARDGFQCCLPSWANLDLRVGPHRFQPQGMTTSSSSPLTTWLDLRTGEAGLDGVWRCGNDRVTVRIRLLIPRGRPHGAFWELELHGMTQPSEIVFGLNGRHLNESLVQAYEFEENNLLGRATTRDRKRELHLGLRWKIEGARWAESSADSGSANVRLSANGPRLKLRVHYAVFGGTEPASQHDLRSELRELELGAEDGTIRAANSEHWRSLWKRALDVTALPLDSRDRRFLLAQHYYLLASYDGTAHPTGPLGLSGNCWEGQMLWDTDLWHFGALNVYWPELARQPVQARLNMLPGARRHAAKKGLSGAWFGWMCDEEGNEKAPSHYQCEIHINAWIALAAWHSSRDGEDASWLGQVYPIISSIADAVCTRAERDGDGTWHFRKVLPPDEAVVEDARNPGTCDDSVTTNLAFRTALRAASAAAKILGETPSPRWTEVADGLVLLPVGPDGIIPEYLNYSGHDIKQADLILAFWPLALPCPRDVVLANLDYYRKKVTWGPLMTEQIDACIRLRHGFGNRDKVLRDFISAYRRYVRGAFEVPYECVDNTNSLMLTACGGLILALTHGWFQAGDRNAAAHVPRLGCV